MIASKPNFEDPAPRKSAKSRYVRSRLFKFDFKLYFSPTSQRSSMKNDENRDPVADREKMLDRNHRNSGPRERDIIMSISNLFYTIFIRRIKFELQFNCVVASAFASVFCQYEQRWQIKDQKALE